MLSMKYIVHGVEQSVIPSSRPSKFIARISFKIPVTVAGVSIQLYHHLANWRLLLQANVSDVRVCTGAQSPLKYSIRSANLEISNPK